MGMGMSMGLRLSQKLMHKILVMMPSIQWSLVNAYKNGQAGPPPFVPPTFDEEIFEPRLKLERRAIVDFDTFDHVRQMQLVDEANEIFRFAYTRGRDDNDKEKGYFKIPLRRDRNIMERENGIDEIKRRISRAEYVLATAMLSAVGEMERIARAVPYHGLYKSVTGHLRKQFGVGLDKVVLVSIDRGGRIPCLLLQTALGLPSMETLKVDQGGGRLDEDMLRHFENLGTLRDKHVLFVDSTVDSGRQIRVLERYFDDASWKTKLAHMSWSIVGSNEDAENLSHHHNVNWGVDPDTTFEDNPELMGVDYARGDYTKVVEVPSEASEAIRKCLLSVPAGVIYDADDIAEQINSQFQQWHKHQAERKAKHKVTVATAKTEHDQEVETYRKEKAEQKVRDEVEREWSHITNTKRWKDAVAQASTVSFEHLPTSIPNGVAHNLHNILVIGNGKQVDLSTEASDLIADTLGPYHSFFAGTPDGNPGAVLKTVLKRIAKPEVRLYQPGYREGRVDDSFGGVPVVFRGQEKTEMREQMVQDSHIALVLGGAEGTLRETLLALKFGKPSVMINGWGPIPTYLLRSKKYTKLPHLKVCNDIAEAMQTIMDMTKM
ncbi:MAG: hypothetical protein HY505_01910 [Candidatus Yanofskybacteria bacterium]|nr:hypothetical protein [Candidatus Yanofskybacteria bacterium]